MKVMDLETFETEAETAILAEDFSGIARMTAVKLSEGKSVLAVTLGGIKDPLVKVYDYQGKELWSWNPLKTDFQGELPVSAGDINDDGNDEIIVSDGPGGTGEVRIFTTTGKELKRFNANGSDYHLGVETAVGDVDGDKKKDIIISIIEKDNKEAIKFFNADGKEVLKKISIDLENTFEPLKIAAIDVDGDKTDELLIGKGFGNKPFLKTMESDGTFINEFRTYNELFNGGVFFTAINSGTVKQIVTGAGFGGGPHVKVLDYSGTLRENGNFFAYNNGFTGGVNITAADFDNDGKTEIATLPFQLVFNNGKHIYKFIEVDISEQRLYYYENGKFMGKHPVSTGTWSMPTPLGEYRIFQKAPRAFSSKYGLYMPYWMSFKPMYGIHELPEWPGGYKEGANHLGLRASHGCIRLGVGPAKILYNWTPIGTKVFIHN